MSAVRALIAMSTQRGGAAACDGQQHLFVLAVDPLATALNEGLSCTANDVGHLQRRPVHALCVCSPSPRIGECIQRTAGGAEMPPGEMQIDRGFLQVAMPQQHLDGSQVGTGFEQMRGKAVAQSVGMDVLVLKAGAFGGLLTGGPENLGGRQDDSPYAIDCRGTASRWACASARASRRAAHRAASG